MKKILLFSFVLLTALIGESWAQERTISGKVTSVEDGSGLPGVNVVLKGTTNGTITDVDGNYQLSVPSEGGTLTFSFIGLATEEIEIGARSVIDVAMSQDAKQLSEVVVTAAGIERESRELGYAVTSVSGDEMTKARSANVVNSLSGKVAGVQVIASGGSVGASSRVVIRGNRSINGNNQPLYVVDGIPISNSNVASVDRFTSVDYGNRIQDINPDDIESMSVLKGAAATALYGQRANNGAIIITMKKGKKNSKTSVTVNTSVRFDNPFRLPEYQNSYGQGTFNKIDSTSSDNWGPRFGTVDTFVNADGNLDNYTAQPNNVKDFYETGKTVINTVALAGGDDKSTYRLSITNFEQEGFVPNTELRRVSASFNATRELSSKFRSGFGVNYIRSRNTGRPITGFNDEGAIASVVTFFPRNTNIDSLKHHRLPDGTPRRFLGLSQNPYWSLRENIYTGNIDRVISNASIGYRPTDWIDISWKIGADVYFENRKQIYVPIGTTADPLGAFWTNQLFESNINSDLLATVSRDINQDLSVTGILGFNVFERFLESDLNNASVLTDPTLFIADNALDNSVSEAVLDKTRLYGAFFDIGFGYKDFLFLNITGRNDWNSTLPEDNQSYFYPGVSASAVLTEAFPSIQNDILSFARVRANLAQVGGATGAFQLDFTFIPETSIFQIFGVDNTYPFRGSPGFSGTGTIPPKSLRPEITNSWEVGTELQLFNGRILVDVSYYNTLTKDQIIDISVAPSTGFLDQRLNGGEVSNKGIELLIEGKVLDNSNLSWTSSLNFAKNTNTLESLPEPFEFTNLAGTRTDPSLRAFVGKSLGTIMGDAWRRDAEGNILINRDTGLRLSEDNQEIGDITPDFTLGWSNTISYKGVTLTALVDWKSGGDIHSQTVANLFAGGHTVETEKRDVAYIDQGVVLQEEDDEGNALSTRPNDIPITYQEWWEQQNVVDEDGVFDATYVKLREASISYSLPQSLIEKIPFGSVKVGVEGRNLLLLYSKIPHIDPEVSFYGPLNVQGIEAYNLPSTRSFGFNVQLTF